MKYYINVTVIFVGAEDSILSRATGLPVPIVVLEEGF